jgi:hypothetical protein
MLGLHEITFKSFLHEQLQQSPNTGYRCCRRLLHCCYLQPRSLRFRRHEGTATVGLTSSTMLREGRIEEGEEEVRKLIRKKMAADVGVLACSKEAIDDLGLDGGGVARLRTAAGKKGHGVVVTPI